MRKKTMVLLSVLFAGFGSSGLAAGSLGTIIPSSGGGSYSPECQTDAGICYVAAQSIGSICSCIKANALSADAEEVVREKVENIRHGLDELNSTQSRQSERIGEAVSRCHEELDNLLPEASVDGKHSPARTGFQ